jgi:putative membrane protein
MQLMTGTAARAAIAMGALLALGACKKGNEYAADSAAVADSTRVATGDVARDSTSDSASGLNNMTTMSEANIFDILTVANQGEIDYSKLGLEKVTSPELKTFARMLIKDHTELLTGGKELAGKMNVTPAASDKSGDLREEQTKDMNDLREKSGADANKEFIEEQIDMHQETMDLLEDLDDDTNNADLKAAIEKAKPTVQAHLDRAKALKDQLKL